MLHLFAFLIIAGVAYANLNEGIFGALVLLCLSVVAGTLAMNFYEPIAQWLGDRHVPYAGFDRYADAIIFLLLFGGSLLGLRALFDRVLVEKVRFPVNIDRIGALAIGAVIGIFAGGALFFAFQMMPLDKGFLGYSKESPILGIAPDAAYLRTMHHLSDQVLERGNPTSRPIEIRDALYERRD